MAAIPDEPGQAERAAGYRQDDPAFARWAAGYGLIQHDDETQIRVCELARYFRGWETAGDTVPFYDLLMALDRLTSAGLWLVVHQT